jgi:hypothetical protein
METFTWLYISKDMEAQCIITASISGVDWEGGCPGIVALVVPAEGVHLDFVI